METPTSPVIRKGTATSPVIRKDTAKTMSFADALQEVINGKKITRLEWSSNEEYGFMKDERLLIHTKGQDHLWIVSSGDIVNSDWVVLPV